MSEWDGLASPADGSGTINASAVQTAPAVDWGNAASVVPDDTSASPAPSSPDFGDRMSADWNKRNIQEQGIEQRSANGQPYTSTLFQNAGNLAGRASDLVGNAVGSAARTINDNLIPQSVDDAASSVAQSVGNSDFGQNFKQGAQYLGGQYDQFAQSHPEAAANLDAAGNISQIAPLAKPVGSIGGFMKDAAGNMLPEVSPGVADIAANATKAGVPLSVGQVAPDSILGKGLNALKMIPLSGSNNPEIQTALNKAVLDAAGVKGDVMTAPALQARAKDLSQQFQNYTANKIFPATTIKTEIPNLISNVDPDVAGRLRAVTDPLLAEAKLGPVSGESLDKARIAANELMRSSDDYGTKQAAGKLQDAIVNTIVGQDPSKAADYKKLLGDYKAYKTVEDTYAQSKAGNIDPTAFQQAVMKNYGGDKALIDTPMGQLAKVATTYGTKPSLKWKIGSGLLGLGEAAAVAHSPEYAIPAMIANRGLQTFVNRNPAVVKAVLGKNLATKIPKAIP